MTEKQLERYLHGKYIGIIKGNYDYYCPLRYKEINNFVQNVGRYADLEVIKLKGYETLFDTYGQFINRIWPDLSTSDRMSEGIREDINKIAFKLQKMRENDPYRDRVLPKVKDFMENVFSEDMSMENEEIDDHEPTSMSFQMM